MVTVNFTIIVQLVLFLVFLWGLQKLVLGPMMRTIDEREATISQNKQSAVQDRKAAGEIEAEYARGIAQARREAAGRLRNGQAEAIQQRNEAVRARRAEVDAQVDAYAEEAQQRVLAEKSAYDAMVPKLAEAMIARLRVKEGA